MILLALALLIGPPTVPEIVALIERGDLDAAAQNISMLLKSAPADAGLWNLRGIVEARRGDVDAAEAAFRTALKHAPASINVLENLGRLYQEHRQPEQAIAIWRQLLKIDTGNSEATFQLAYLLAQTKRYSESLTALGRLSPKAQQSPQALAVAVAANAGLRRAPEAEKIAKELAAHPRFTEPDALIAVPALREAGLNRAARSLLEAAVAAGGAKPALLIELAKCAYDEKDYQGALSYLAHARHLQPDNAGVHFFLGLSAVALDLPIEAKSSLGEALRLEPSNPYYQYAMGAVLAQEKEAGKAIPYFEKYCSLKPDDPRGRFALGAAYYLSNQYPEATAILGPLTRDQQTAAGAHFFLGRIAKAEGRLDEAERELKASLKLAPAQPDVRAELGQLYTRTERYDVAERELQSVLQSDSDHYLANRYLLALYRRTGDSRAEAQMQRMQVLDAKKQEKERLLWRTVEVRPY